MCPLVPVKGGASASLVERTTALPFDVLKMYCVSVSDVAIIVSFSFG